MSFIWNTRKELYNIQGNWNASTNSPNISTNTTIGFAWNVTVAGTTTLGDIISWDINDIALYTIGGWTKIKHSSTKWGNISGTLSNQIDLENELQLRILKSELILSTGTITLPTYISNGDGSITVGEGEYGL